LLAGFRAAAVGQVLDRLDRLHAREPIPLLAVSGGVAANRLLRRALAGWADERGVELRLVPLVYSGDNAAMIAHAALLRHRRGLADDPLAAEAESRIAF
ncbi:MAG: tRNA (adenosine(37)-N6)-threonylcarbamoyltransferase complex transferase subunit TsaD, partial [Thermoanaerobaculia bacterium]